MFKKITILLIILLSLSSCLNNQTSKLEKKDIKEKNIINNTQKVEEKGLGTLGETGSTSVSSGFTK